MSQEEPGPRRAAERVTLTLRRDKLHLEGAAGGASTEPDILGRILPPEAWRETLLGIMPHLVQSIERWDDLHIAREFHYRLADVHPWKTLRLHCCAGCREAWYVAHHLATYCEACDRARRLERDRASNARMVERRAQERSAARAAMTCEHCGAPMSGRRLRRYCSAAHRQAACRERQRDD